MQGASLAAGLLETIVAPDLLCHRAVQYTVEDLLDIPLAHCYGLLLQTFAVF